MAAEPSEEPVQADADQEDDLKTLKYHLLGPSLTKAGQDKVDQSKVSSLITSNSVTKYYIDTMMRSLRSSTMPQRAPSISTVKRSGTKF